ncbi:hypothetical protein M407DRAFT_18951 [Tulasnella calospora MUT 4182]|uniref:Uncharacterized protein n=1 Tax=Tulasnella calospora MUT 4182 TaxID=1051891 RepID=A0A0C3QIZ0_9AGAM|nr:hypothetical protein M407DRAFT_18951 [Tulasnella calospora MUT 4182]
MATMTGKRYWLTLHNLQQKGVISYTEERKEIWRGENVEWQFLIHITSLDLPSFPGSENLVGQSYWEYGARVKDAKELVARNILLSLKVDEKDIK